MSSSESDVRERLRQRLQQPARGDRLRQELKARLGVATDATGDRRGVARAPEETSGFGTFVSRLLRGTADAVLATPDAAGDLLAMTEAGIKGTAAGLVPGGRGFEYGARYAEARPLWPQLPRPTVEQLNAGARAAMAAVPGGVSPAEQYEFSMQGSAAARAREESEHPFASGAGDFGSSVAALLLTKKPLQGTIRRAEQRIMAPAAASDEAPGLARDINRALRSSALRLPARGAFRAVETGLEAAYLEVISEAENDPLLAASLAAGGQVASSNLWGGLKKFARGGLGQAAMNFTASAIATGGIWQMLKSASPGGRDRILESMETGFDKVTFATMLGVLGGAMGARGRNQITDELSAPIQGLIEGFTTTNRTAVLGLITKFVDAPEEEQEAFGSVLDRVLADPEYRGDSDLEREIAASIRDALEPEDRDLGRGPRRGLIDRSRQRTE